jgi:hypothetical protein
MSEELILTWWLVCGLVGCAIGATKNRKIAGLLLGILLGPIGCILCMFISDGDKDEGMGDLVWTLLKITVGVVLLGGVVWCLVSTGPDFTLLRSAASTPAPETESAPVDLRRPVAVSPSLIEVVRGVVVRSEGDVAVIDCEAQSPRAGMATANLGRLGGAGDSKAGLASLAALAGRAEGEEDARFFGPLHGAAGGRPTRRAVGLVTLHGITVRRGQPVHTVAAWDGARGCYTVDFELRSESAAATPRATVVQPRATPSPREIARQIEEKYRTR